MRVAATLIDRMLDSVITEDGHHLVLTTADVDGHQITLGIPCGLLHELIDISARALVDSERVLRHDGGAQKDIQVTWWNLRRSEAGDFTLMLTFGSGGTLSFALSERMGGALRDSLAAHLEIGEAQRGFGTHDVRPKRR